MATLKTQATTVSVQDYLAQLTDDTKRKDCQSLCKIMENVTGSDAKMWGTAIIGVGDYTYIYESGRTNAWFMMGFSPRKQNISLYLMGCKLEENQAILARLGKHKTGKGCIYIKTLADVDLSVLKELCEVSYQNLKVK